MMFPMHHRRRRHHLRHRRPRSLQNSQLYHKTRPGWGQTNRLQRA